MFHYSGAPRTEKGIWRHIFGAFSIRSAGRVCRLVTPYVLRILSYPVSLTSHSTTINMNTLQRKVMKRKGKDKNEGERLFFTSQTESFGAFCTAPMALIEFVPKINQWQPFFVFLPFFCFFSRCVFPQYLQHVDDSRHKRQLAFSAGIIEEYQGHPGIQILRHRR